VIRLSEDGNAIFLSYASEDGAAASKICEALRAAGLNVFFDQSELRGGDLWDREIRSQIRDCTLFLPVISQNTQERLEGYFRYEWKLAVDRAHLMATERSFIVPVVIDDTREPQAVVPDAFRAVQWTRLAGGDAPLTFVERVRQLLSQVEHASALPPAVDNFSATVPANGERSFNSGRSKLAWLGIGAMLILAALAYVAINRGWVSKRPGTSFSPNPNSIAVLPFSNMSGDKSQEYFSDGLTEELLNALTGISGLQVAARTSAFSFKSTNTDIGTIARKLNVATLLEGSIRRSGNTVRVTTQLISAVTGFQLWSHTYDRDLGDVLKLETEVARAVADALKVSLLGNIAEKIELGGTHNPAAFDAYLRGRQDNRGGAGVNVEGPKQAVAAYSEAIALDPNYALAFANRAIAFVNIGDQESSAELARESFDKAHADALKAIALAPDLALGHSALAGYYDEGVLDFVRTNEEQERALALAPGDAEVLRYYGLFAAMMGQSDAGIAAIRRAISLDPLDGGNRKNLGWALYYGRRYQEAIGAFQDALDLRPKDAEAYAYRGLAYYALGDYERARASCEVKREDWTDQQCLVVTYDKLGRHAEAETILAKLKAKAGDAAAYQYAGIYAQLGTSSDALQWLATAMRLRDPGLEYLKTDPLLDPLRKDARFLALTRELKFPD
jgi:TolB-like protein/Tfp pilus assembly protein PilF